MKAKLGWNVDAQEMRKICKELGATAPFPWDATVGMWPIILLKEGTSRATAIAVLAKHCPAKKRFYLEGDGKWQLVKKAEMP